MLTWNWSAVCEDGIEPFVNGTNSTTDLGICFQQICLQLPIYVFLAIISSYFFGSTFRTIERNAVQRRAIYGRVMVTVFLAIIPINKIFYMIHRGESVWPADILVSSTEFLSWTMHLAWLTTLTSSGVFSHRGPLALTVCWSSAAMLACVWLRSNWHSPFVGFAGVRVACHVLYGLSLIPKGRAELVRRRRTINDERQALLTTNYVRFDESFDELNLGAAHDGSFFFSKVIFHWVTPLISKGVRGLLNKVDDLFDLPECLSVSTVRGQLQRNLFNTGSLFKALHRSFGVEFYLIGILRFLSDTLGFAGPLLLGGLLTQTDQSQEANVNSYLYALGLFIATMLSALCGVHFNWRMSLVSMKMRIGLVTAIYRKTLDGEGIHSTQTDVVNLMSVDTDRIVNSCASFHAFWSIPFQLVVTLYLLYIQLGLAFIAGVIFAAALIPINRWIAIKIGKLSEGLMSAKDSRISMVSESMAGIKQIKLNAWEDIFIEKIQQLRKEEMTYLAKRKYLDALCVYFWATTPVLMCVFTFAVFVLMGQPLTASTTYTSVALLNMLIGPLNAFPWVLNGLAEAWVSLKRVQRLIDINDIDPNKLYTVIKRTNQLDILENLDERPVVLEVHDGCFKYDETKMLSNGLRSIEEGGQENYYFQLRNVNLSIRRGEVVVIKGPVGSGKTSLLLALLGNQKHTSGRIEVEDLDTGFGFVSQTAWLQRGTLRDNILWGNLYEESRYKSIIACCCLQEDLEILGGDRVGVGENGRTLSGGQRARVALARALYQDKSIYLLDDILSALDAHVAAHIVKHCIFGYLNNRTRIIVTENKTVCANASQILEVNDGQIRAVENLSQFVDDGFGETVDDVQIESELASVSSVVLADDDAETRSVDSVMFDETKETGNLHPHVVYFYWKAMTGPVGIGVLTTLVLMQASRNFTDMWLAHWVTVSSVNNSVVNVTEQGTTDIDRDFYLKTYVGFAVANTLFTLARAFIFAYAGIKSAKFIYNLLTTKVFFTTFQFFDVTPLGRILNRFSSDTYTIDDSLPFILNILLAQVVGLVGALAVSLIALPWLGIIVVPLIPIYLSLQNRYRFASRDIKRLASNALSPLYAHFSETLQGLTTIRAMRAVTRFKRDFSAKLEESIRAQLTSAAASNWLSLRLQFLGAVLVGGAGLIAAATSAHSIAPGLVGLAISYALSITGLLSGVLNAFAETEQEFVAVERVHQYCELEEEKNADGTMDAPFGWPCQGVLSFDNVELKYRQNLVPALKRINLNTGSCERIGIVGRTGAGKSSIVASILRVAPLSRGIVSLDCVNLGVLPLQVLRSRISVVTQDPFLFTGTVRENLDPRGDLADSVIWNALKNCLASTFVETIGGLDTKLTGNLSVGQKQLLCLTRAMLKNSKLVLVDEGTANLDQETEELIQTVLQTAFRCSTVLVIAHRLNGLEHMDRILVMNNGAIIESGPPQQLAANSRSMFRQLLDEQGNLFGNKETDDSLALVKF